MKNIIITITLLLSSFTYSQSGTAGKQYKRVGNYIQEALNNNNKNLQRTIETATVNRELADKRRQRTIRAFDQARQNANNAYNKKDFSKCIYYYESSKKLGWYDGAFEYISALSYYALWEELRKKKYKSKAKKILKKSKKHGYIDAELFLDKNF